MADKVVADCIREQAVNADRREEGSKSPYSHQTDQYEELPSCRASVRVSFLKHEDTRTEYAHERDEHMLTTSAREDVQVLEATVHDIDRAIIVRHCR